jgi:hypothetical protein
VIAVDVFVGTGYVPGEAHMPKRSTGRYERPSAGGEEVAAFMPHSLPPVHLPVLVAAALGERVRVAEQLIRGTLPSPSGGRPLNRFIQAERLLGDRMTA